LAVSVPPRVLMHRALPKEPRFVLKHVADVTPPA
jgi:hypothetical protein